MPHAWGANTSYSHSPHSYTVSNASLSHHHQHEHTNRPAMISGHPTSDSRLQSSSNHHIHPGSHVSIDLSDVPQLSGAPTAAMTWISNSALDGVSGSWDTPASDVEAALPGSQLLGDASGANSRLSSYRDQYQTPGAVPSAPALPRYASSSHRAAIPIPVTPSLPSRSRSTGSSSGSSSGSPARFQRLQRHSSSAGGFLSATASQLLGALSGISLMSSSPTGNTARPRSNTAGRRTHRVHPSPFSGRHSLRGSLLVRAPALLDLDPSESYDDLLALDQFNVKRAVQPAVLAALPHRTPNAQDQQQQRHCFICLEHWRQQQQPQHTGLDCVGAAEVADVICSCCGCCENRPAVPMSNTVVHMHAASRTAAETAVCARGMQQQQQVEEGRYGQQTWPEATINSPFAAASPAITVPVTAGAGNRPVSSSCSCCTSGHQASNKPFADSLNGGTSTSSSTSFSSIQQQQQQQQQHDVLIQQLPCGHEFCAACICTWLKDHATCPVCRWTFPDEHTHLINMAK